MLNVMISFENEDCVRERGIYRITVIGSVCNALLLVFKFVAGILGNSAAMIADAIHSLSDFITDIIVILFVRISNKPQDKEHDYGHGKYETMATIVIGLILIAVGVGILWNGVLSIIDVLRGDRIESPTSIAAIAAVVSIVVKEILYRYTVSAGRRLNSQAVIANAWHHRSDALSSIGTAIGTGGAVILGENWAILDPIAAVLVSVFIIRMAVKITIPAVDELSEKSLSDDEEARIADILLSFEGVSAPHNMRTRHIGNATAIEVHVRMDGNMTINHSHAITRLMEQRLKEEFGGHTIVTIHVEPEK